MSRVSRRGLTALAISASVVISTASALTASAVARSAPTSSRTSNVIVVLRNQNTNLSLAKGTDSPRVAANRIDQSSVVSYAKSLGASRLLRYRTINAFAAKVTAAQAASLAADPSVARVYPDLTIRMGPSEKQAISTAVKVATPAVESPAICPSDPSQPLLEPEALQTTNTAFTDPTTPQAQNLVDGTGVSVAYIADGIDINNPDFIRADGTHVFTDYQDFSGEGPNAPSGSAEAFGDASAIAAQGRQVYDLSNFVNPAHPLPAGCNITIRGVAPGASLVGLKVFGNSNSAPTSRFIEAIDYAVSDQVNVLNESFGGNPYPDNGNDPITLADNAAVAAGVTVVSSTGDSGTDGTIGSPATDPNVIGVGASTIFRSYLQTTGAGSQLSNGTWISNNISAISSGGVSQAARVPDLVAPGDSGWALCSPNTSVYEECTSDAGQPSPIQDFGGTSQASPLTAGGAALVIEAYRNTHGGVTPAPALVKELLTSTATDLNVPATEQGAGELNTLGAVEAAESWTDANGSPAPTGINLVVGRPTQLSLVGNPGASSATKVTVRNVSNQTQVISGSTRRLNPSQSTTTGQTTLDTATAPTFIDAFGISRSYVAKTFAVGRNVAMLDVSNAADLPSGFSIRIILMNPQGAFTAYSIPQGYNNFSNVDVHAPMPGVWTAYFAASTSSGFNGPVFYKVTRSIYGTMGTVTPSAIKLAPGKTGTFTVNETLPSKPGDVSASVQFKGKVGGVTMSVPLTLRTVIPAKNLTFSGTITGGNGRAQGGPAQTNIYDLQVPAGKRDLSIGFTFSDPDEIIEGVLSSPDGQVYSFQSNAFVDGDGNLEAANGLQIYRRAPAAGQWILTLDVTNPVSGDEISQSFTAHIAYNTVQVHAVLPTSSHTTLAAGVPVNVPVTIKNTGTQPLTYFADGRLSTVGTIPLAELSGNATTPLPVPAGITPFWLVPTETQQLTLSAVADQPVNADFFYLSGEPDQYSAAVGNGATVVVNAAQVSPGIWETDIGQTGPFSGPAPAGTVTVSASAQGNLFDPAISSTTGDIWQEGVDPSADPQMTAQIVAGQRNLNAVRNGAGPSDTPPPATGPVLLAPGQSTTITVTITPSAPSGSVVSGTLYIDDFNSFTDGGDELAAFPYTYTVQ
jgi:hypothetical protein